MHLGSISQRLSILYTILYNKLEKDMFENIATTTRVK